MREIKFRGKRLDNKEWVYGFYIHYQGWHYIVTPEYFDEGCSDCGSPFAVWHLVDIGTVGQYTGLKDKNGKEIYEGDIVHYKSEIEQLGHFLIHEQVGEIKIDKGMTGFKGKTKQIFKDEINIHDSKFIFLSSDIYEVIGNIYENPELMEMKGNEENISTQARV